jgi:hypothetical protein
LIHLYLHDEVLSDKILYSEAIKDKAIVITGKTGARIFPELLEKPRLCYDHEIRSYLSV